MRPVSTLRGIILALVFLLPTVDTGHAQTNDTYERINDEMEGIRQLELLQPINVSSKTRAQLQEETARDLQTDYPAPDRENDQRVLVAFGLIRPEQDIGQLYVDLLGEQVAGYYDPETDEMVVVSDDAEGEVSASSEVTYAHEVVHALQDQHFDLLSFDELRLDGSDDVSLAITSLIEGDATATQIQYLTNHPDLVDDLMADLGATSGDQLDNAPAIVRETLLFPYNQGPLFIEELLDEGDWDAVDAAYASPPTSTEQILHPEKYLAGEQPVPVTLPDVAAGLGQGWTTFDTNTMGEFQTAVLLDGGDASRRQADEAAAGWAGDSYSVVGTAEQDAIVWNSQWDSEEDAAQFAETLAAREAGRLGGDVNDADSAYRIDAGGTVVEIVVSGTAVSYVLAPDGDILDRVRTILAES